MNGMAGYALYSTVPLHSCACICMYVLYSQDVFDAYMEI